MSAPQELIAVLAIVGLATVYLARRALRRIKLLLAAAEEPGPCDGCRGCCAGKAARDPKEGCGGPIP
jgi:hypothetical protein